MKKAIKNDKGAKNEEMCKRSRFKNATKKRIRKSRQKNEKAIKLKTKKMCKKGD